MRVADVAARIHAGTGAVLLHTAEEDRGMELAENVATALGWPSHTWSAASGADGDRRTDLSEVLQRISQETNATLWMLLDAGSSATTPVLRRALREACQENRGSCLFLIQPSTRGVEHVPELPVLHLPLPDAACLAEATDGILSRAPAPLRDPELADRIARAGLGLTRQALEQLVREAVHQPQASPNSVLAHVRHTKPHAVGVSGALTRAAPAPLNELGGLDAFKGWLQRRALALDPAARRAAIPAPRGVLLVGVQGCGKSLAARVTATVLDIPLFRLDPGRLFGGTVGESEANLRSTLEAIERLAPAVLWVDELDKGLAGSQGPNGDSGTTARVVGGLLTWLQERERPVFVAATANHIDALPPELLRRGRLDEVFFVDLPDANQRAEILRVHLEHIPRRTLGDPPKLGDSVEEFLAVARSAQDFSGAELQAALVEARLCAFAEQRPVAANDFRTALDVTVPLARSHAESIASLRQWARERARIA